MTPLHAKPRLFLLLFCPAILSAQPSVELHQAFLDLSNDAVLMDLSAHPDDEDGATLAYYRMKFGVKTYSVLFTRGEGGQNEMGPELYEDLGVIRSSETEQAGKVLGADVYFLNLMDFGFSKTATETFRKWGGQQEVLRRLVYIIRKLKPDVVMTNHNTVDGHGHHQAVAITAIAAFDATADSTFFPEQLRETGVTLWQPRKLFFRAFGRSEPIADVSNSINEVDALRKTAYIDIALSALKKHKTQGMERADLRRFTRGKSLYKLMRSNSLYDQDSTNFFSGINYWAEPSLKTLLGIRSSLSLLHAETSRDSLLHGIASVLTLVDSVRRAGGLSPLAMRLCEHWEHALEHAGELTCGLRGSFRSKDPVVVSRQKVECALEIAASTCDLSDVKLQFDLPSGWAINERDDAAPEVNGHRFRKEYSIVIGEVPQVTLPKAVVQYESLERRQAVVAHVLYSANGNRLAYTITPSFDVAPPQTISVSPKTEWIPPAHLREGKTFEYTVMNYLPHKTAGNVSVQAPRGWSAESSSFVISQEDSAARGKIVVRPPLNERTGQHSLVFKTDYASTEVIVKIFDAAVSSDVNVGIVKSYDTTLEAVSDELGVHYRLLDEPDLRSGDLSQFQTIVVDIRAYLVREDLKTHNKRLLDYVRDGGNLLVMYQRDPEWRPEYAPYPFDITRRRVTVEEAPIVMLEPGHPLLNTPNRITKDDWKDWIQERGLYFPANISPKYIQLLSTNDPDEPPLTTGYLVAGFGKGSYIYTSFVWYRQLKESNPGAYRCFANMISYPVLKK